MGMQIMRTTAAVRTIDDRTSGYEALLPRIGYYLAVTAAEREEIYRLRYRAYVAEGAYPPNETGIISDHLDQAPNVHVVGVRVDGELAAAIRLCVISSAHPDSSAAAIFPEVVGPMLAAGKVLVDPNRFVADPDRAEKDPRLPFVVARLGFMAVQHFRADVGLATPRAEHCAFYRRLFGLEMLAEPRLGWGLKKPIALMGASYEATLAHVRRRYPFVEASAAELAALFGGLG